MNREVGEWTDMKWEWIVEIKWNGRSREEKKAKRVN